MIKARISAGLGCDWSCGEDVYEWWISKEAKDYIGEGQIEFFEEVAFE